MQLYDITRTATAGPCNGQSNIVTMDLTYENACELAAGYNIHNGRGEDRFVFTIAPGDTRCNGCQNVSRLCECKPAAPVEAPARMQIIKVAYTYDRDGGTKLYTGKSLATPHAVEALAYLDSVFLDQPGPVKTRGWHHNPIEGIYMPGTLSLFYAVSPAPVAGFDGWTTQDVAGDIWLYWKGEIVGSFPDMAAALADMLSGDFMLITDEQAASLAAELLAGAAPESIKTKAQIKNNGRRATLEKKQIADSPIADMADLWQDDVTRHYIAYMPDDLPDDAGNWHYCGTVGQLRARLASEATYPDGMTWDQALASSAPDSANVWHHDQTDAYHVDERPYEISEAAEYRADCWTYCGTLGQCRAAEAQGDDISPIDAAKEWLVGAGYEIGLVHEGYTLDRAVPYYKGLLRDDAAILAFVERERNRVPRLYATFREAAIEFPTDRTIVDVTDLTGGYYVRRLNVAGTDRAVWETHLQGRRLAVMFDRNDAIRVVEMHRENAPLPTVVTFGPWAGLPAEFTITRGDDAHWNVYESGVWLDSAPTPIEAVAVCFVASIDTYPYPSEPTQPESGPPFGDFGGMPWVDVMMLGVGQEDSIPTKSPQPSAADQRFADYLEERDRPSIEAAKLAAQRWSVWGETTEGAMLPRLGFENLGLDSALYAARDLALAVKATRDLVDQREESPSHLIIAVWIEPEAGR